MSEAAVIKQSIKKKKKMVTEPSGAHKGGREKRTASRTPLRQMDSTPASGERERGRERESDRQTHN